MVLKQGVLQGKNYSCALTCYKALNEGLDRMLLQMYAKVSRNNRQFLGLPLNSIELLRQFSEE